MVKAIEITLFNMDIDPERVSAKDFDQARRLISGMDQVNERAEASIAKIREDADKEIEGLVNQLDVLTIEIKAKQPRKQKPQHDRVQADDIT